MSDEPFDSAEGCQLQRDHVAIVLHELGNITSALSLRVDGPPRPLSATDTAAIATLTAQLRIIAGHLSWLRGSAGHGVLAPTKDIEAHAWWSHVAAVATSVLPRGSRCIVSDVDHALVGVLPADHASVFTMLTLAACRHFTGVCWSAPVHIVARLPRRDASPSSFALAVTDTHADFTDAITGPSRWRTFSERTAHRARVEIGWWAATSDPHSWHWHCAVRR